MTYGKYELTIRPAQDLPLLSHVLEGRAAKGERYRLRTGPRAARLDAQAIRVDQPHENHTRESRVVAIRPTVGRHLRRRAIDRAARHRHDEKHPPRQQRLRRP